MKHAKHPKTMLTSAATPVTVELDTLIDAIRKVNRHKEQFGPCMCLYIERGRLKVKLSLPENTHDTNI